jgi:UDP-N-acetylglucosamine 2-epimerase
MKEKCKILTPVGCRSDAPLSKPIIERLEKQDWCEIIPCNLNAGIFYGSYGHAEQTIWDFKPDILFATADRIEMAAAACAAFHNNVPIIHYFSGIVNEPLSTMDDLNRHVITLYSELQFCEDWESFKTTIKLLENIGKEPNTHIVGCSHFDNMELDNSFLPNEPYDLILYNPTTMYREDYVEIIKNRKYKNVIWLGSNPDSFWIDTIEAIKKIKIPNIKYYEEVSHEQFLSLLKNCQRIIGNSSAMHYYAPLWHKPENIIQVGDRNLNRSTNIKREAGASDKIVKILEAWWNGK